MTEVLIVPLWNWNRQTTPQPVGMAGFNRTFMELKLILFLHRDLASFSFNRTFMELKFPDGLSGLDGSGVLIVPLWNWNSVIRYWRSSRRRFNRTFMELKSSNTYVVGNGRVVLIVPLWNWNLPKYETALASGLGFNRTFMELKLEQSFIPPMRAKF